MATPNETELAVGDKVKTKLGRAMVVVQVYPVTYRTRYTCSWTAADGATRQDMFSCDQLELLSDPTGPAAV